MRSLLLGLLLRFLLSVPAFPQDGSTNLNSWLNDRAQEHLRARKARIAAIRTPAQARARQEEVRRTMLTLLGGWPKPAGPLNARVTGTLDGGPFTIEKVVFESRPRYYVTANLYKPKNAPGRRPAILYSIGHWREGKPAAQPLAANLAAKGFIVLAYDPVGQGERDQAFDPRTGRSLIGGPTDQHFSAGAGAHLAGLTFARYLIQDSQRALDYLVSRPDVDPERIGATGCSGGGTQTTFISALDPRVKAAAPACFLQSFELSFANDSAIGDSEQSWPGFIAAGLDETDFVTLFAPKPWLIASTQADFFRPDAARAVYEEARAFYTHLDQPAHVSWVVGPGGHGTPRVVREAIYGWFIRHLNRNEGDPQEIETRSFSEAELWAGPTGAVAADFRSRDVHELIREDYASRPASKPLVFTSRRLPKSVSRLMYESSAGGVRVTQHLITVETGLEIGATLYQPDSSSRRTALLLVEPAPKALELAQQGYTVLTVRPRGTPFSGPRVWLGDWMANTRAWLTGRSLVEQRVDDLLAATDFLALQAPGHEIRAAASGVAGLWLLLARRADPSRLARVWVDRTPHDLCSAIGRPLHWELHDAVWPGFCAAGNLTTSEATLASDPQDWNRNLWPHLAGPHRYRTFTGGDAAFWVEFLR